MSHLGQKRRFGCQSVISGLPTRADIRSVRRRVADGPIGDLTDNFTALFNVLT